MSIPGLALFLYKLQPKIAKVQYNTGQTMLKTYPGGVRADLFKLLYHDFIPNLVLNPIAALISSKAIIQTITEDDRDIIVLFDDIVR